MTPQAKLAEQVRILEALAALDGGIKKLDAQIEEEQSGLDGLQKELISLDAKLGSDRQSLEEMQKTVNELSLEARQMSQQLERSREKMGRARNERETVAAEREMDELRKLVRDREEEVGKLTSLGDIAKKSIADVEAARAKVTNELSSNESDTAQRIRDVKADREARLAERAGLAKQLPTLILRRYEQVRRKKGSGLARVVDGTCTACYVSLPPQLFQRLMRQEEIEQCPNCQRMMYWAPPAPPQEPPA